MQRAEFVKKLERIFAKDPEVAEILIDHDRRLTKLEVYIAIGIALEIAIFVKMFIP